jgi:ADP-ribosylglycohydrolase
MRERLQSITGALLGAAVGDALGVPREGLSPRRAARLYGNPPLRHHFLFGHGMVSDDTEHACLVAQALLRAPEDAERFARSLAWGMRWWFLGLPAGLGRATLRACVRLWLGFPPDRSGVFSAGNGPAMRAALLGVCLGADLDRLRAYVRASTRITHTDPKAEHGAMLVALAAHYGAEKGPNGIEPSDFLAQARNALVEPDAEILDWLTQIEDNLKRQTPPAELAKGRGLARGVSGYIYHTVPMALYCWLRWPGDFRRAVEGVIALGGDADTTAAIVGGVAGATLGAEAIPAEWVDGLWEWPRSVKWMRALSQRLAKSFCNAKTAGGPLQLFWPGLVLRNLLFLAGILLHIVRRLLPPY